MIKTFKNKTTKKIYNRKYSKKLPRDIQRISMKKLWMLDAAPDINSLRIPPGNRLELLYGDREGQYSIRINDQWRICFRWHEGNSYEVELVDYH
ncbi:MAG TPA: type II toxin-antitoxin system RelE/ParE family toxin [Anaerolineae bacterium]|nr:type II toxin-antitoxin system RelE/ParE family toxin [Anaerolineae bacterium]